MSKGRNHSPVTIGGIYEGDITSLDPTQEMSKRCKLQGGNSRGIRMAGEVHKVCEQGLFLQGKQLHERYFDVNMIVKHSSNIVQMTLTNWPVEQ